MNELTKAKTIVEDEELKDVHAQAQELVERVIQLGIFDNLSQKLMQLVVFSMGDVKNFDISDFKLQVELFLRKFYELQSRMKKVLDKESQATPVQIDYSVLKNLTKDLTQFPVVIEGFCLLIDLEFKQNPDYDLEQLIGDFNSLGGALTQIIGDISS